MKERKRESWICRETRIPLKFILIVGWLLIGVSLRADLGIHNSELCFLIGLLFIVIGRWIRRRNG